MTDVETWTVLYLDGIQVASASEKATHIPSDLQLSALIAADVLRAARRVIDAVENPAQEKEADHGK